MKIIELVLLILLLFFAAVTAASEIAIIATSKIKLRRRAAEGSRSAKLILNILETPERFFGTILVANNIVDALIASLVTAILIHFVGEKDWVVIVATAIVSFLIIVSETAAKTFAARNADRLSTRLARSIKVLIGLLSPVVKILEVITNFIVNLMGGQPKGRGSLVTEEEMRALIKVWEAEDIKHKERAKMLSRVFDLSETVISSIMRPRAEMAAINIDSNIDEIIEKVLESGYSRLPVYKDKEDNIIGIINMKDLLTLSVNKGLIVLQDIVYPPAFVPGSKKVIDLLKDFQKGHTHIAIVLGPKDSVDGIVTLEDILEEIVGEIEDEYDVRGTAKVIKKKT
jgi:CBS domain containing-hemolysin-like protein